MLTSDERSEVGFCSVGRFEEVRTGGDCGSDGAEAVRTSSNRPTEQKPTSDLSSLVSILSVSSNGTDSRNGGDLFESNDQSGMYLFRGMHPDAMSPLPPSSPFPVRKEMSAGSTAAPALPQQA
jgi:hypothetical protein